MFNALTTLAASVVFPVIRHALHQNRLTLPNAKVRWIHTPEPGIPATPIISRCDSGNCWYLSVARRLSVRVRG